MRVKKEQSLKFVALDILEKTIDGYIRLEDFLYNTHIYAKGYDRPLKKSSLSQAVNRLKKQGMIEEVKLDHQILLKLTQIGKDYLELEEIRVEDWDGKWRVVIFDIPEQKRIVRNLFRRNLKRWGFKQLQKSVWISKRGVYDKLVDYTKELKIEKWVSIMEVTRFTN